MQDHVDAAARPAVRGIRCRNPERIGVKILRYVTRGLDCHQLLRFALALALAFGFASLPAFVSLET